MRPVPQLPKSQRGFRSEVAVTVFLLANAHFNATCCPIRRVNHEVLFTRSSGQNN